MTALRVVIEVPAGEQYQAAVATRVSLAERPQIKYVKPGERLEVYLEDGAHLDLGKAKLPPAVER